MQLLISLIMMGMASQYAPGVMESVIRTRQAGLTAYTLPADLSQYSVFVAMEDCSMVGDEILIRPVGGTWERGMITDCSGDAATSAWMIKNGIVVEIDGATAARWNTVGRGIEVEVAVEKQGYVME